MLTLNILIFIISAFFLAFSSKWLIDALSRIAKFLGWKEFVVAFFVMAIGASLPNFFVDITAAFKKIPELALGDVVGGNIIDFSLLVGLSALISKMGLSASSKTVQGSSIFTIGIAILPLILIWDGTLSRIDGFLLFIPFIVYVFWIFRKEDRFKKVYDGIKEPLGARFIFKNFSRFFISILLLIIASQGIIKSSVFFADHFNLPIGLIGILIVGIGNSLPEAFFSIQAARRSEDWLLLGDLLGGVVMISTLVLGTVVLISPIKINNFFSIAIGRIFLIISAIFFLIFLRTGKKITKKEGLFLILIYVIFLGLEIIIK